jgi:hypothetical protein
MGLSGPGCPLGDALGSSACPGCGLTRSTALALHGDWVAALSLHAGGFVVVLACLAGIALHGHVLATRRRSPRHDALLRFGRFAFALGILGAWAARLVLPVT